MAALTALKPYAQLLAAALVALTGVAIAGTAVGHLVDPVHIGLWQGPHAYFFGAAFEGADVHQLPESTLYGLTLVVAVICFFIVRELLGFARAGLKRRGSAR